MFGSCILYYSSDAIAALPLNIDDSYYDSGVTVRAYARAGRREVGR